MKVKNQRVVVVLVACIVLVQCQIDGVPSTTQTHFYLDRYSDCNGPPREVGQSTIMIVGFSTEPQDHPVNSCTITLNTENAREPYIFRLNLLSARIDDPGTYFYIYDGQSNGKLLLTFSKNQTKPPEMQFVFTTGQMVTFKMSRGELERNSDIRVVGEPMRCDYRCHYSTDVLTMATNADRTRSNNGNYNFPTGILVTVAVILVYASCRPQL